MAYYEDIVEVDGKVKCILCEICLSEDNKFIDSHINDDDHMELYVKRIMIRNNIIMRQGKPYCLVCDTYLSNLDNHIQDISHQHTIDEIRQMVKKDGMFLEFPRKVTQKASVHCTICDCDVQFTIIGIKEHIRSTKHMRSRAMALQILNGIFSVEGTDTDLWCKICQVYFENYIEIIFEHVDEDEKHVTTLNKIYRLIKDQKITIDKYLTNANEDKAKCNKCSIEVPCNADNLERHVKGKRHKNA